MMNREQGLIIVQFLPVCKVIDDSWFTVYIRNSQLTINQ
jgi:hypothetical protein